MECRELEVLEIFAVKATRGGRAASGFKLRVEGTRRAAGPTVVPQGVGDSRGLVRKPVVLYGIRMWKIHVHWLDWSVWKGALTFFELLDHASLLSCQDARDHVYAFLVYPSALNEEARAPSLIWLCACWSRT